MHEMQAIVTDVIVNGVCPSVCQSVCHAAQLSFNVRGSFGAALAKSFWPFVDFSVRVVYVYGDCHIMHSNASLTRTLGSSVLYRLVLCLSVNRVIIDFIKETHFYALV